MSTETSSTTWLTQDAYDRLSKELRQLIDNRPAMAQEINDRREEGDLKENGGYHAAREEQGKQEGRILQLTQLLRDAKVGEAPTTDGTAGPGMVVTVRFDGDDDDRDLPDRLPRGGRHHRPGRVLLGLAAGPGADRRQGGRARSATRPRPARPSGSPC